MRLRLRPILLTCLLTLFAFPSFAVEPHDRPADRGERWPLISIIMKFFQLQPLEDPYISPPRP